MTYINSGMPFYCGKPSNVYLLCEDWEMVKPCLPYPTLPWTDCERELIEARGQQILRETVSVTIGSITEHNGELITLPTIPCSSFNLTYLWTSRNPTGFFFNGTWHLRHCQGIQPKQQLDCLQNRTLYLLGDSTIRQWYSRVIDRFGCTPTTERWTKERWHKLAECKNQNLSFVAGWYPHSQPFYVSLGDWDFVRYTLYSIARRIDNIHRNEYSVVVIHLYMHVVAYHFSVFRERMVIIRRSVERLLEETTTSKVLIKAPHTFRNASVSVGRSILSDYFGFVYSHILYEVFDGLHDKVVLLNQRNATTALNVEDKHPPGNVVDAMIDQMLSYACNY